MNIRDEIKQNAIAYGTPDSFLLPRDAAEAIWFEKAEKIARRVPFCVDWVVYKGETVFAAIDYEKSVACGRPIIEVSYCATQWFNRRIIGTHNYDPKHFKPSILGTTWKNG